MTCSIKSAGTTTPRCACLSRMTATRRALITKKPMDGRGRRTACESSRKGGRPPDGTVATLGVADDRQDLAVFLVGHELVDGKGRDGVLRRLEAGEILQIVEVPVVGTLGLRPLANALFKPVEVGVEDGDDADRAGGNKRLELTTADHQAVVLAKRFVLVAAERDLLAVELQAPGAALGAEIPCRIKCPFQDSNLKPAD